MTLDRSPSWALEARHLLDEGATIARIARTVGATMHHVKAVLGAEKSPRDDALREWFRAYHQARTQSPGVRKNPTERSVQCRNRQRLVTVDRPAAVIPPAPGSIATTDDGRWVQCHICGEWFAQLGTHIGIHEISAAQYIARFGLPPGSRLVAPARRVGRRAKIVDVAAPPAATRKVSTPGAALPQRHSEGDVVLDHWGDAWRINMVRAADGCPDVYLGRPVNSAGPRGPAIILTREIVAHLETNRLKSGRAGLPLGTTSLKRIRALLGHQKQIDAAAWWEDRADDLASMTIDQFAAKHGRSVGQIHNARHALFGRTNRPKDWWRDPEIAAILLSDAPRADIADQIGISIGSVGRLRWRLKSLPPTP